MATAVRDTVKTEVTKVEHVPVIKLELSEDEAKRLYALMGGVAGGPQLLDIRSALENAGIRGWWHEYYKASDYSSTWRSLDDDC